MQNDYALDRIQQVTLAGLRAFERAQQDVRFDRVEASQTDLDVALGDSLERALAQLPRLDSDHESPLREPLHAALTALVNAKTVFCHPGARNNFAAAFIASRNSQADALERLYQWRESLPVIEPYFRLPGATVPDPKQPLDNDASPVGIRHWSKSERHHECSIYVPEYYDKAKQWPLIVCLHGGYGRGDEYLWTWLRIARSRGFILLSPKSTSATWSIGQPRIDTQSVMSMIDELGKHYVIDASRVFLSGLSDGGTFSYLLGLEHAGRFSALAPIAGVLPPTADPLVREKRGLELPIHVVHGAEDMIFPVETARSTNRLLQSLGYQLTYTELADWGHALTYDINENIVLPWLEQLEQTR